MFNKVVEKMEQIIYQVKRQDQKRVRSNTIQIGQSWPQ